jgi:putative phosphoesterase
VLEALARLAPVTAVRGNNDKGPWAQKLRQTEVLELARTRIYVIHNLCELELDPAAAGIHVVVAGHSHRPTQERRDGVLYVNPGSAGPRRFKLPISVARLALPARRVSFRSL